MFVAVNGARLFVDVEGVGLQADGDRMRQKPTLILLHGGPGTDHSLYKPGFSRLADIAQIIYLDHRGNGRSGGDDPATWNLAQWGDDVRGLCDVLGIERPIVFGASFGGFVAQAYATRHPEHPSKLILASTAARIDFPAIFAAFEAVGGPAVREAAETYWLDPTPENRADYIALCFPFYQVRAGKTAAMLQRSIIRNEVAMHFNGPANEQGRMDFRADLARLRCPVLVMAGERDPVIPMAFSEALVASLPPDLVRFERFSACGHGILADAPERALALLRDFILDEGAAR